MYRKSGDSWLKHLDFIVLDLVALQLAYISSYCECACDYVFVHEQTGR